MIYNKGTLCILVADTVIHPLSGECYDLDKYFKDKDNPTEEEVEVFQMVIGVVPVVEERHGEKL